METNGNLPRKVRQFNIRSVYNWDYCRKNKSQDQV